MEVTHAKTHRTKEVKEKMTQIETFVTESNEKTHELAKAGAMIDEFFMTEARAEAVKQETKDLYVVLQYAASFHCLKEEWKDYWELKSKL